VISLRSLGIPNLIRLGREQSLEARDPLPAHRHRRPMEICYLASGEQTFEIGERTFRMQGGDVLVSQPGQKHSTGAMPLERSTLYWLLITLDAPDGRFLGHGPGGPIELLAGLEALGVCHFRGAPSLQQHLDRVFAAFFHGGPLRSLRIQMLVTEFLIEILDLANEPGRRDPSREIITALACVHDRIREPILLETLAEQAGLSLSRFKQRFRQEVGMPPREYVLRQKVEAAREMLRTATTSVTHVAHDLSFSSSQYFATVFRRFVGLSPTEFRRGVQSS